MQASATEIWVIIAVLGVGTYLIRWSFLGALGDRDLPNWMLRMLRYTPVAVLPALVAPLVVWPAATVAVGVLTRNLMLAILAGGITLAGLLYLL